MYTYLPIHRISNQIKKKNNGICIKFIIYFNVANKLHSLSGIYTPHDESYKIILCPNTTSKMAMKRIVIIFLFIKLGITYNS